MQKLKDMKIKKRLNTGFKMVTGIATIAAVLGIIAMLVASGRYEYAMTNYGFSVIFYHRLFSNHTTEAAGTDQQELLLRH